MSPKGYAFPLYSLDLRTAAAVPEDDPRFSIPVPEGFLVVSPGLRRRAAALRPEAYLEAVDRALIYHGRDVPGFAALGHTSQWADHLRHWVRRLWTLHGQRLQRAVELALLHDDRRQLVTDGRQLWDQLRTLGRLAGYGAPLVSGAAPRSAPELLEGLDLAAGRLAGLAQGGALAPYLHERGVADELDRLRAALRRSLGNGQRLDDLRSRLSHELAVIRAALLGDLLRLARAAPLVLTPALARELQPARLFSS